MTEDEIAELPFLPKQGAPRTLYLYFQSWGRWGLRSWNGKEFDTHGQTESDPLEANYINFKQIEEYADALCWTGWNRVVCRAGPEEINPCVRVEFEFSDGRIQRLTGQVAEDWINSVNNVLVAQAIRYGQSRVKDYSWECSERGESC